MNKISKNILLVILLGVTLNADAQNMDSQPKSPEERGARMETVLMKNIDVTKEQKEALTQVFTRYANNMQTYRTEGTNKEMLDAINNKRDAGVKEILNDDNKYSQYLMAVDEMKKKMDERRKEGVGPRGGHGGGRRGQGSGMGNMGGGMSQSADNSNF
ncbi:MAG: hypothetical protein JST70_09805 [Bacteroidetes bacterium]|nr:hypothetical protein [Bacteroidota bacterium]